jgi:hypothetical protein
VVHLVDVFVEEGVMEESEGREGEWGVRRGDGGV